MNASAERNLVECLLTWGPAAWGELLSLKRLYHTNYLIHVSADVEVIDGYPTNSTCRIYNVGSSEADARILVKDAEVARQVSFKVGKHWEWQVVKSFVVLAPCKMRILRVGTAAKDLTVELLELFVLVTELDDLCRAHEGEVEWPEEYDLPLALIG